MNFCMWVTWVHVSRLSLHRPTRWPSLTSPSAFPCNPIIPPPIKIQHEGLHTILLDVTKPEQVQSAADRVSEENPQGLYALVNNAGAYCNALDVGDGGWRSSTCCVRLMGMDGYITGIDLFFNTGVARSGLIDWFTMQDFRFCMEVRQLAHTCVYTYTFTYLYTQKNTCIRIY